MIGKAILKASAAVLLFGCSGAEFEPRELRSNSATIDPSSPSLSFARAQFRNGNFALAAQHFRRAIREHPNEPEGYNGLAASYDQMGRFDLSRRYYEEALALAPSDGPTRNNFALSLRRQGLDELAADIEAETARMTGLQPDTPGTNREPTAVASGTIAENPQPEAVEDGPILQRISQTEVALLTSSSSDLSRSVRPERVASAARATPASAIRETESGRRWSWPLTQTGSALAAATRTTPDLRQGTLSENGAAPGIQHVERATELPAQTELRAREVAASNRSWAWNIVDTDEQIEIRDTIASSLPMPVAAVRLVSAFAEMQPPMATIATLISGSSEGSVSSGASRTYRLGDPVAEPHKKAPGLRILNGVGRRGQATRLRQHLRQSPGFTTIAIADTAEQQEHSVITYPAGMRPFAVALARELPFVLRFRPSYRSKSITVTLGTDSVPFDYALQARFLLT